MIRVAFLTLAVAVVAVVLGALAATNNVPTSNAGQSSQATGANDVKPPQCTMTLTGFAGSGGNELILGTAGADKLNGASGSDCIVGGAGADKLNGGPGNDVCIGGGQAGDTFTNCETVYP